MALGPRIYLWASGFWLLLELMRGGIPWTAAFAVSLGAFWALSGASPKGVWKDHPQAAIFLVCLIAYLSTFRWHGGDDITSSLIPVALLKHGTLALTPVIDPWLTGKTNDFTLTFGDHMISFHPIGGGLLAVPLYIIPVLAHAPFSETFLHNLSKLSGSLITALSAAVFYAAIRDRCSKEWALATALFYGLGTFSFSVSSQALWEHGPAQLGFAVALLGLSRSGFGASALAGFGMGIAFVSRTDSAILIAAVGCYLLFHARKRLPGTAAGAALPLAFLACYWYYFTGRVAPPESDFTSTLLRGFQPEALAGLIISPTRGLAFFFPLGAFGAWAAVKGAKKDPLGAWLLAGCVGFWVFISCYFSWVGGMSFGPRYLAVVALLLAFLCAGAETEVRKDPRLLGLWVAAGVFGILVHALGGYFNWPGSFGVSYAKEQLWYWHLHPVAFLFTSGGPLGGLPTAVRLAVAGGIVLAFAEAGRRALRAIKKVR